MRTTLLLLLSSAMLFASVVAEMDTEQRRLGGKDVDFDPDIDYCKLGETGEGHNIYGDCIPEEHFPDCGNSRFVCYNRINRHDKFYPDKVPHYYIDPVRILCYPNSWLSGGGCSTCTPGRYCLSEKRCIIDELVYECAQWL